MSQQCLYIGCQGWRYPDWRAVPPSGVNDLSAPFYPANLPQARELEQYSRTFNLVEVDATFYAVPKPEVVRKWAAATPETFRFALKLPRALTHEARLQRGRRTLAEFCDTARELGKKLAAVLIQLPPSFGPEEFAVLERFVEHLSPEIPFAVEFRDPGWFSARTLALLRAYRLALTLGDTPWISTALALDWLDRRPTDWLYLRFMGIKEGGLERFSHLQVEKDAVLDTWAGAIQKLTADNICIYAFLDNHFQGFSPGSAVLLQRRLGLPVQPFPRGEYPYQLDLIPDPSLRRGEGAGG